MPHGLKRYQTKGHDHFITFSCHHRLPYLADDRARITFPTVLEQLRQRHSFYLFGYVLMPEHVHLLLCEPRNHALPHRHPQRTQDRNSKRLKGDRP